MRLLVEPRQFEGMARSLEQKNSRARSQQADSQLQEANDHMHAHAKHVDDVVGPGHSLAAIPRRTPRFRVQEIAAVRVAWGEAGGEFVRVRVDVEKLDGALDLLEVLQALQALPGDVDSKSEALTQILTVRFRLDILGINDPNCLLLLGFRLLIVRELVLRCGRCRWSPRLTMKTLCGLNDLNGPYDLNDLRDPSDLSDQNENDRSLVESQRGRCGS